MSEPAGTVPNQPVGATAGGGASDRFAFGRNWQRFASLVTEERIQASVDSLRTLLRLAPEADLAGKRLLDIGCGSGLSSLAALRLGAEVTAFDYDEDSVATTRLLLKQFAPADGSYAVQQGSVLDSELMATLGQFDLVYSWGVLHHTGEMWRAIDLAAAAVAPGGHLALALYNDQGGASRRWAAIKRAYVRGGPALRWVLVFVVGLFFELRSALIRCLRLQNPLPFKDWRKRRQERGMSVWHDLVDWVGGYPFEVAKPEEVLDRLMPQGFTLVGLSTCAGGHACNEFLFRRAAQAAS